MADPANSDSPQKQDSLPLWSKWVLGVTATIAAIVLLIWLFVREPIWSTIDVRHAYYAQQHQLALQPTTQVSASLGAFKPAKPRILISQQDIFNDEDQARKTLATIIGGLFVGLGTTVGFLSFLIARQNIETAERKNAYDATLAERKLNTDRYATAVDMLSTNDDNRKSNRVGGIFLLEKLVQDQPEFYSPVMDVLLTYLRDTRLISDIDGNVIEREPITTDVQAALTVVGRINQNKLGNPNNKLLGLHKLNLEYAYLSELNFSYCNFSGTSIAHSTLRDTDLSASIMAPTDFTGAYFIQTVINTTRFAAVNAATNELIYSESLTAEQLKNCVGKPIDLPEKLKSVSL